MKITEASKILSEQLGDYISDSFVRFYDKHILGLERQKKNRYREITDVDIKKLKKIYALSKISIPVKLIKSYFLNDKSAIAEISKRKQEITKILDGGLLDEF